MARKRSFQVTRQRMANRSFLRRAIYKRKGM